jgi:Ca2+-transporting ATPase
VTSPAAAPAAGQATGQATGADETAWHMLTADRVLHEETVDAQRGLSRAEVASRAERFGLNKFDAGKPESRWHAFIRQYADPMQLVLLVAGIGSLYPLKELGSGILLLVLTLFNAVLGLRSTRCSAAPGRAT